MLSFLLKNKFVVFVLALSLLSRGILLDRFPTGISNDELHFILNAKSVFYRFSNMAGNWSPLSLSTIPEETSSELPFLFLAPFVGPLPTNLFNARLPYVFFGTVSLLFIFLTVKKLTNKPLAVITLAISAINPWFFYVTRTSFDAPLALMFFLIGIYLVLRYPSKLYLSLIPLVLGFYCYIGTKTIWPFLIITLTIYSYLSSQKNHLLSHLIFLFLGLGFFTFYALNNLNSSRTSELWMPSSPKIINQVSLEKNQSLQNPFKPIITNTYTIYFRNFIEKYLNNFSPDILFTTGDHTFMVSLWKHGYFYYPEAILIIAGIIYFYLNYRPALFLLISLIAISPIPEAIRSDSIPAYAFHSVFQYPFLYILVAGGILLFSNSLKNRTVNYLLVFIYLLFFINFLDIYFFKYPVYQPEGFNFSRRIISRYLFFERQKNTKPIIFLTPEPDSAFRNYLFYNNLYTSSAYDLIKTVYQQGRNPIEFNGIIFTSDDRQYNSSSVKVFFVDQQLTSRQFSENGLFINHLGDNHRLFTIYNGSICQNQSLDSFAHNLNLFDLNIESLPETTFCQKFISR
jgi:hypothetical protein